MSAILRLTMQQILGGKKAVLIGLLLFLPTLLLAAVRVAGGLRFNDGAPPSGAYAFLIYLLYPQSFCIVACLLYGSSLMAAEIEGKTLVYLFTRAQPRWKVLLGKYLGTVALLVVASLTAMTASCFVASASVGLRVWLALAASVTGACITYTAIFALLGLLIPRRAIPAGLLYAVLFEGLLSFVPAMVDALTASHYLRSMALDIADIQLNTLAQGRELESLQRILTDVSVPRCVGTLLLLTSLALAVCAWIIHRREWPLTEGV